MVIRLSDFLKGSLLFRERKPKEGLKWETLILGQIKREIEQKAIAFRERQSLGSELIF